MKRDIKKSVFAVLVLILIYGLLYSMIYTGFLNPYYEQILIVICINIILAASLNLITGFTGQLSLGHAGFMSIGAYTAAVLSLTVHTPFAISIICSGIMAALMGILIGIPALRLRGDYLAITTLGFGEIIRVAIVNIDALGGPRGMAGIPKYTTFTWSYFLMALTIIILFNIIRSSQGRAMISIREDEVAAEAMGINTTKYKIMAFSIAAFFAGIAGALYAHFFMFLEPGTFNFIRSFEILTYVVLGGMGSITGSIFAAILLTALPEALRFLSLYRMVIYALALILLMLFRPQGLMGTSELRFSSFGRDKIFGNRGDKNAPAGSK